MKAARTDVHRPGALIPAHYRHLLSFNGAHSADGWPVPSYGFNCELDRRVYDSKGNFIKNGEHSPNGDCCIVKIVQTRKLAVTGREHGPGKCTSCGANFIYGDVWLHEASQEIVFLGHDCADKYEFHVDRSAWELAHDRLLKASAKECEKARKAEAFEAFFLKHEGLEDDLDLEHPILRDLSEKLLKYENLSDKQIALARKIADEIRNPQKAEQHVTAPTGKQTFKGVILSAKVASGIHGDQLKITVKVTTPLGTWLAWGTCPAQIIDESKNKSLKGVEVEISATLKPGKDAHFALMSYPNGRILSLPVAC